MLIHPGIKPITHHVPTEIGEAQPSVLKITFHITLHFTHHSLALTTRVLLLPFYTPILILHHYKLNTNGNTQPTFHALLHKTHAFIAGDFNAHSRRWNCRTTTRRGTSLHNIITHYELSLHAPNTSTASSNPNPSIIDLAVSNNPSFPITTNVINDLSSDNLPEAFKIDLINPISSPSVANNLHKFNNYLANSDITFNTVLTTPVTLITLFRS